MDLPLGVMKHGLLGKPETSSNYGWRFSRHVCLPWGKRVFFSGCTRPGYVKIAIGNGPIEIVDLPSYKMLMFHSFLYVYQRVSSDLSEVYPTLFSGDGLKS